MILQFLRINKTFIDKRYNLGMSDKYIETQFIIDKNYYLELGCFRDVLYTIVILLERHFVNCWVTLSLVNEVSYFPSLNHIYNK